MLTTLLYYLLVDQLNLLVPYGYLLVLMGINSLPFGPYRFHSLPSRGVVLPSTTHWWILLWFPTLFHWMRAWSCALSWIPWLFWRVAFASSCLFQTHSDLPPVLMKQRAGKVKRAMACKWGTLTNRRRKPQLKDLVLFDRDINITVKWILFEKILHFCLIVLLQRIQKGMRKTSDMELGRLRSPPHIGIRIQDEVFHSSVQNLHQCGKLGAEVFCW